MTATSVLEISKEVLDRSDRLDALLLFVAGFETAEVCSAIDVRNTQLKTIMDYAIGDWRTDRIFRAAYDEGVQRIREYKHHFFIA